jgi:hypothetical protein
VSSPTATSPFVATFTFSESVTGFVVGDITSTGFTLTDFAGTGAVYTCNAAFTGGSGTLQVEAGKCIDAAGNANAASNTLSMTYIYSFSTQPDAASGIDTYVILAVPDTPQNTANFLVRTDRRNLVRFDLSSIPGTSTIVSATLTLTAFSTFGANVDVTFNRILAANAGWLEIATWNFADGATASDRWAGDTGADGGADAGCSVSGTDYSATQMGAVVIPSGATDGTQIVVTLNVSESQAMLANNAGIVFIGNAASSLSVFSSDAAVAGKRPKLDITYTNP